MSPESNYREIYNKYRKWTLARIEEELKQMRCESDQIGSRNTSEGFKILNDSANNLKYSVLIQLSEEKKK